MTDSNFLLLLIYFFGGILIGEILHRFFRRTIGTQKFWTFYILFLVLLEAMLVLFSFTI